MFFIQFVTIRLLIAHFSLLPGLVQDPVNRNVDQLATLDTPSVN